MSRIRSPRARQLLALCYAAAALFWAAGCLVGSGIMLDHKLHGRMPSLTLGPQDLALESMVAYTDLTAAVPDDRPGWYLSTDDDPHLLWQGDAYVETVCLHAEHLLPPGAVALYYLRPGQTDYSETQKVFARVTAAGEYTFALGGKRVSGLRLDPDSRGGVPTRLVEVQINPVRPWYLRFLPSAGWWLVLLFVPPLAAAFLAALLPPGPEDGQGGGC